ncbi:MAG TPA: FAD-binding protein [Streptosporangiaceae bacterium]|nr:FAD-binding protein [Streptosporangiaceae bacterium]
MTVVTNWAGNVSFGAARFHQPDSVAELRRIVALSSRVRALGTGHSFNLIADTTGSLISLARLPTIIALDAERARVTVSADVTYGELASHLHGAGYALANLASLPHISVAGACATGTHGSGDSVGNLATAVSAIEMVTADGELVAFEKGAGDFAGAVVALGALGIVVSMSLDIEPTYYVSQHVYDDMRLDQLYEHFDEIFASGYSVSLFTTWRGTAKQGPLISQAWVKQRVAEPGEPPPARFGARLADGPRHPVPGRSPVHCTQQLGVPGPWHQRLPHFRLDYTPSAGRELQSEFLLPRSAAVPAIRAIDQINDVVAAALQISEIRTIAADDLWLSPSYRRDSVGLHFTWIDDMRAVAPVIARVEEQLAPFDPRPHWGKLFTLPGRYDRLPDFLNLMQHYDSAGKFRNKFLDNYLRQA